MSSYSSLSISKSAALAVGQSVPSSLSSLAKSDISAGVYLKPLYFVLNDGSTFLDKHLPKSYIFPINEEFDKNYFVSLHNKVISFGTYNYSGSRTKLGHSKINLSKFRELLPPYFSDLALLQYLEFGFPLGLVENWQS